MKRLTQAMLALLCALQLFSLWRSPAVWWPSSIAITLAKGQALALGGPELAAAQADPNHLGLRRDHDGNWWIRNLSPAKQLLLGRADIDTRIGRSMLTRGQQLGVGSASFHVDAAGDGTVTLTGQDRQWHYDGATLLRNGSAQPACPDAPVGARLLAWWNRAAPHALTVARPLAFGGNLHCGNRLGIAHLPGASATLARIDGQLWLGGAAGLAQRPPLTLDMRDLAQSEHSLNGVSSLLAGRTRLALRLDGERLLLRPLRNVALSSEARIALPAQVEWQWQQRALWSLPGGSAWWLMLGLCAALAAINCVAWQRGHWPFVRGLGASTRAAAVGTALLVIAGVGALLFQRAGAAPGVGLSIVLGWAALWSWFLPGHRLTLAGAAGVLLLAAGLLAQLELGLGAMESSWLRYFQKSVALLAVGLGIGAHLRLRLQGSATLLPQGRLELTLAVLASVALAGLLVQVLFGDETGVFDVQPVEFAKLALTALTAHCIAIGLGRHSAMPEQSSGLRRWCRLGAPALLFAGLLGLALVQVDDFSPLILLLVWGMAMALAWSVAARQPGAGAAVLCLALGGAGMVVWLRHAGVDQVAQWGFYGERFLVWLDPAAHPHTGHQLLLAANGIAQGDWWGMDGWLGLRALGQDAGSALFIPAVQDDFAPSFFLNRHGLLGALALWVLQVLFLTGLLQTAARAYGAAAAARDFRHAWLGRFRCFTLCGGAAFVLGHLLLSWGTNLAIFPIMGQPMSFLSAGGSHLLLFICPLLTFCAISAQSIEENQSCRSTSNMKC